MEKGIVEMGFAKLDTDRKERTGFAEVIFCQGKEKEYLLEIMKQMLEEEGEVFGTRASLEQYEFVRKEIPEICYDPVSRILKAERKEKPEPEGLIAVCSGGTSDAYAAEEAAQTAEFFGSRVERFFDIGVSGLHRMQAHLPEIRRANCVIAVAGMEGALASVLGGQVRVPVIAVPTSVGYGTAFEGITALLAMMTSCANGISVVNIDNGYGAGYIATQINRLAVKGSKY